MSTLIRSNSSPASCRAMWSARLQAPGARYSFIRVSSVGRAAAQHGVELVQQRAPAALADLRLVAAVEKGGVLGEDQPRACPVRQQFDRAQRGRDPGVAAVDRVAEHDAAVGHDVGVAGLVAVDRVAGRAEAAGLKAADAEIESR